MLILTLKHVNFLRSHIQIFSGLFAQYFYIGVKPFPVKSEYSLVQSGLWNEPISQREHHPTLAWIGDYTVHRKGFNSQYKDKIK